MIYSGWGASPSQVTLQRFVSRQAVLTIYPTNLFLWLEEGTVRKGKCLVQEHIAKIPRAELKHRLLDRETGKQPVRRLRLSDSPMDFIYLKNLALWKG